MTDSLAENLRVLASYGRSTSDLCRRAGINRQQFNKYLSGQTQPSLSTLRRLCDFFGVDEHEMLLDSREFRELIRLRPPKLKLTRSPLQLAAEQLVGGGADSRAMLERHEGYYHTHFCPDPARGYILRSICRIYQADENWYSKSVERHRTSDFMLPPTIKYTGIVVAAHRRLVVYEREFSDGQSMWSTMLYAGDYDRPNFLSGLVLGISPDGSNDIGCSRTVWQYLGRKPDLRKALSQCGPVPKDAPDIPDFVRDCTDNSRMDGELVFTPRL